MAFEYDGMEIKIDRKNYLFSKPKFEDSLRKSLFCFEKSFKLKPSLQNLLPIIKLMKLSAVNKDFNYNIYIKNVLPYLKVLLFDRKLLEDNELLRNDQAHKNYYVSDVYLSQKLAITSLLMPISSMPNAAIEEESYEILEQMFGEINQISDEFQQAIQTTLTELFPKRSRGLSLDNMALK